MEQCVGACVGSLRWTSLLVYHHSGGGDSYDDIDDIDDGTKSKSEATRSIPSVPFSAWMP